MCASVCQSPDCSFTGILVPNHDIFDTLLVEEMRQSFAVIALKHQCRSFNLTATPEFCFQRRKPRLAHVNRQIELLDDGDFFAAASGALQSNHGFERWLFLVKLLLCLALRQGVFQRAEPKKRVVKGRNFLVVVRAHVALSIRPAAPAEEAS